MPESPPKDLRYAENLRREGKFQEALKVINNIEKKGTLTPKDQLTLLILKGKIYTLFQNYIESVKVGEITYKLSQGLESAPDMIMALLFKANGVFLRQSDEALNFLLEAEELLGSLKDASPTFISRQKANILFRKSWAYYYKGEFNKAFEAATECLKINEKFDRKSDIAYTLQIIGFIYDSKREPNVALDYASKSLELFEEIGDSIGAATTLSLIGRLYYATGDLNNALVYFKKSLSGRLISDNDKLNNQFFMGVIYNTKGELDRALRHFKRGGSLAEKLNVYDFFINSQIFIGSIYIKRREYELALEYLKPSLALSKNTNNVLGITLSLFYLTLIHYERDSRKDYQEMLDQIKEHSEKYKGPFVVQGYQVGKAMMLKKSRRSRDRAEAESLLKQVIEDPNNPDIYIYSLVNLCEFYLEELQLFNEPELIEELNPLIGRLLKFSEEQNSYAVLAETKLLQAKVALIQMDFDSTKKFLTESQRIAELHGLNLIAQKISSEHDNLLDQIKTWEDLKERDAPIEERLKLASVDGVIERLQGKRAIEPPELIEEEPISLLIMDKSGISYFNYSFIEGWDFDWLFSSFMSAFDTFSSEIFAESIDRIKIGENLILINPIESFLVCYVIKGQSYLGLQKLNRFSNAIKENTDIWESLNRAVKTGEVLELNKPQSLGIAVNKIFT
ncbi:MAG: tetratricopeptide repeat protein [Promethearchaeota archaeon]|jgi:tetratricopeptide (TPR) repeat protein